MELSSAQLLVTLKEVFNSPHNANEQELFYALVQHKAHLLRLFNVGPRSASELKDVESGKTTVRGGKGLAFNADFARGVVFLAQQLDCSERYCAELLEKIASREPNLELLARVERVVLEFHLQRRDTASCLRMIFQGALSNQMRDASTQEANRIATLLHKFSLELIRASGQSGAKRTTLAGDIIAEIDRIEEQIKTVKTALSTPATGPRLSDEALSGRLALLRAERHQLGFILFHMASTKELSGSEIARFITWLRTAPARSEMACYVLAALLVALSTSGTSTTISEALFASAEFTGSAFKDLKADWNDPPLRAAVQLLWTLFLSESRAREPSFGDRNGFNETELEKFVWDAVQSDAFEYLSTAVRSVSGALPPTDNQTIFAFDPDFVPLFFLAVQVPLLNLIAYMPVILRKIKHRQEDIGVTSSRSQHHFFSRSSGASPSRAEQPPPTPRNDIASLFRLVGELYDVLPDDAALPFWTASSPEDEYDGKLPAFLRWVTESRDPTMVTAAYQMLSGLSKGRMCSELAYNFLSSGALGSSAVTGGGVGGAFLWATLFSSLDYYASVMPNPRQQQQQQQQFQHHPSSGQPHFQSHHHPPQQQLLPPQEVNLTIAFLHLLEIVATYSPAARLALFENPQFKPLFSLLSLISCSIPLELKAALFSTLAAFCGPGHGAELAREVWDQLEKMEVLAVKGGFLTNSRGVKVELEEVETPGNRYPSTQAFIKLLNTLVHTPKDISTSRQHTSSRLFSDTTHSTPPNSSIPVHLGPPSRPPGLEPYLTFVIDDVLLRAGQRSYSNPSERWIIVDASLHFLEKCLASFEIDAPGVLDDAVGELQKGVAEPVGAMLVHPGFDILIRLLTETPLRKELESFLREGIQVLTRHSNTAGGGGDAAVGSGGRYFESAIVRVLRIVHRVLEIQGYFLDGLIPLISQFPAAARFLAGRPQPASTALMPFDQNLLFQPDLVVQIALYVTISSLSSSSSSSTASSDELVLLAVRILGLLAESSQFSVMDQELQQHGRRKLNRLAVILGNSEESEMILGGFVQRLGVDESDQEGDDAENWIGAGAPDSPSTGAVAGGERPPRGSFIRSAILDLLLLNTQVGRPAPNIAHLLLGFDQSSSGPAARGVMAIRDPQAMGAVMSCLHRILELLGEGVAQVGKQARSQDAQNISRTTPLFARHPQFAEKCYRLLHQLCVHGLTSSATTRYLRTREDFFLRQLAALPMRAPEEGGGVTPGGVVVYADQSYVQISCEALSSFLRMRSWVLESAALELHLLTDSKQHQRAAQILDVLFGSGTDRDDDDADGDGTVVMGDEMFRPFAPGQELIRILELLQSFDMEWQDAIPDEGGSVQIHYYAGLDFTPCHRLDAAGCEIIDASSLVALLSGARRTLVLQGLMSTPQVQQQLNLETRYLLESCTRENHRRQIEHARRLGFESWRQVLDIALAKCFDRLPHDRRESILFDILQELVPVIRRPLLHHQTAARLSETVLSLITRLREDRHHQLILQSAGSADDDSYAVSLPTERLYALFRNVLECIVQNGMNELVRGNLYAALVNYFHLIESVPEAPNEQQSSTHDSSHLDLSFSLSYDDEGSVNGSARGRSTAKRSTVEVGTLAIINSALERLIPIICRDAIDGSEVWKTVAFTLLNSLLRLSRVEKQHRVLAVLVKHGFLANFVYSLKDAEADLLAILKPDPDNLNTLYVYEAKMAFLIRMAQTRQGAERMMDARVFTVLAQCDYLDARPEADQAFMDYDTFLPSAIERYHQLLLPALQLADSVLATLGSAAVSVSKQALDFVLAHRETVLILLKDTSTYMSLSMLRELQLVVSLCSYVAPRVERHELFPLATPMGFAQIHQAILTLAAKTVAKGRFQTSVVPINETEEMETTIEAPGYHKGRSVFQVKLEAAVILLQRWVLVYLVCVSEPSESSGTKAVAPPPPILTTNVASEFFPVFHPIASTPREGDPALHVIVSAPTMSDAISGSKDVLMDLTNALDQVYDISLKLANKDTVGVDEIDEIAQASSSDIDQLDVPQRRLVAFRELEKMRTQGTVEVLGRLHSLEMLLLLLWKHLDHFLDAPGAATQQTSRPRLMSAMSGDRILDVNSLHQDAARSLAPLLQRLEVLELPKEVIGSDYRSRMSYIAVLCRRLRELSGVRQQDEGEEDEMR